MAASGGLQGQKIIAAEDAGVIAISDKVFSHVGEGITLLTRPPNNQGRFLVLMADAGDWRIRLGDQDSTDTDMPHSLDPTSSITDGSGAIKIPQGEKLVIPGPAQVTVRGFVSHTGNDCVLTYYWL